MRYIEFSSGDRQRTATLATSQILPHDRSSCSNVQITADRDNADKSLNLWLSGALLI